MKILAIGDPHGRLDKIKKIPFEDIELILLTGDIGNADLARKFYMDNFDRQSKGLPELKLSDSMRRKMYLETYRSATSVVRYLSKQAPVYLVSGNADYDNYYVRKFSQKIGMNLPVMMNELRAIKGVRVINNQLANFNGIRIGGLEYFVDTSWVRDFAPNDKNRIKEAKFETQKARRVLVNFDDVDILLCHQPPYGVLDITNARYIPLMFRKVHQGSKVILDFVKRKKPDYVFCGHIHEGEGFRKVGRTNVYNLGVAGYKIIHFN